MKSALPIYSLSLASFLTLAVFTSYSTENGAQQATREQPAAADNTALLLPQVIESVKLADEYDFAGEPLPMDNFDVRERRERELLRNAYYHSSTILKLKKMPRFFPTIEKILTENGVPGDMKFLAVAESDLSNATSPAGAKGYWQFLKGTALEYGLEVNGEVDERMDLEKSTRAACQMLKNLKNRFGNWTMAAAAYNMGAAGLSRDAETQRSTNYYDLNLNEETGRYVFRIMAMKEILKNPNTYGYYIKPEESYPPLNDFKLVEVNTAVENLGDFAKEHGTTYRMIKVYNPWLVSSSLVNKSRKTYFIKIPKKKF